MRNLFYVPPAHKRVFMLQLRVAYFVYYDTEEHNVKIELRMRLLR